MTDERVEPAQPEPDGGVVDAAGGFGIVPAWVVDRLMKRPGALALYTLIAARYVGRDRKAWPSRERMAADLGVSIPTIDRGLRALRETRALEILKRRAETGKWDRSVYVLRRDYPDGLAASIGVHDHMVRDYPLADPQPPITDDRRPLSPEIGRTNSTEPIEDSATLRPSADLEKVPAKDVATVFEAYRAKVQPGARLVDEARKKIRTRLGTYSTTELLDAIDRFSRAEWWMEKNARQGAAWFFRSDSQVERFLALEPDADNARRHAEDSAASPSSRYGAPEPAPGLIATRNVRETEFANLTRE